MANITISQTPPYANVTKENIVHHLVSRTDHIEGLSFRVTKAVKEEVSKMTEDVAEKRMTANDTIVRKMKLEIAALENSNMKLTAAVHNNCLGISFKEYEIRRAKEEMALLDQRLCDIQTETEALKIQKFFQSMMNQPPSNDYME